MSSQPATKATDGSGTFEILGTSSLEQLVKSGGPSGIGGGAEAGYAGSIMSGRPNPMGMPTAGGGSGPGGGPGGESGTPSGPSRDGWKSLSTQGGGGGGRGGMPGSTPAPGGGAGSGGVRAPGIGKMRGMSVWSGSGGGSSSGPGRSRRPGSGVGTGEGEAGRERSRSADLHMRTEFIVLLVWKEPTPSDNLRTSASGTAGAPGAATTPGK